jgi:hypothetical protein
MVTFAKLFGSPAGLGIFASIPVIFRNGWYARRRFSSTTNTHGWVGPRVPLLKTSSILG